MDYISIINLVFFGIGTLISIYLFHFAFFALSSLLHKKTYPSTVEKCRYGIIISAKDEENVIARVINSIRKAYYPQDKLDIYVIAHNCSDHTGDIAKSLGAAVIIDNNKEENTLGQAYKYAFSHIDNISSYDGFIFFNADNIVAKDYFTKLNDAFVYYHKNDAISTFRHSLNMDEGVLPAVYSYYFTTSCVLAFSGRNNFNVSGRVTGCGFVIPSNQLLDGWKFTSITEDIEYSTNSIANGKNIRFCYAATFYDEQPTKVKTMWHQRERWAKGQQIISKE
jgi:cellulose synthase/poly-beta-1,6-N-acetylglucosamine synthase-like glycosyltransferase